MQGREVVVSRMSLKSETTRVEMESKTSRRRVVDGMKTSVVSLFYTNQEIATTGTCIVYYFLSHLAEEDE